MSIFKKSKAAQAALYTDTLSAWGYIDTTVNRITSQALTQKYQNVPCKLTRDTFIATEAPDEFSPMAKLSARYVIHTSPEVSLKANDRVEVTYAGGNLKARAGESVVYNTHAETSLLIEGIA